MGCVVARAKDPRVTEAVLDELLTLFLQRLNIFQKFCEITITITLTPIYKLSILPTDI